MKRLYTTLSYLILIFLTQSLFAEGSKELNANGGYRAFLVSGSSVTSSFVFPTLGTMKVYARAGETIFLGSSVQGLNSGTMNLRAPNGNTYTSGTSKTVGVIANRTQEQNGPLPNTNGYTPYKQVVQPGEEGVWEIDFIAENNGISGGENPVPILASAAWTQPLGQYIAAFDVSVRNAANTDFIKGRVFTNIFSGILGDYTSGFNGVFYVLTQDGYQYSLDNNGQAGNGFSFFVNNKGFRQSDGTASYKSVNTLANPNIQDPRAADTQTDITYKLFFNTPSVDLPGTAATPGGGSTWLLNPVTPPSLTNVNAHGAEGTINKAGTNGLSSVFEFTANKNGTYNISIDINHNGIVDGTDRVLSGNVLAGINQIAWDGRDANGNKVNAGSYTASANIVLFGGEVHFPFFDVERNLNGLKLIRTNGANSPDLTIYWDDTGISATGTPSNPVKNTTGLNSFVNGHKWGSPGSGAIDFGDEKGLDTWSYIPATPVLSNFNIQLQEADLEVINVGRTSTGDCVGQTVTYTINVRNNGPSNITGGKFNFTFPATLTNVSITNAPFNNTSTPSGNSSVTSESTTNGVYTALLNMPNSSVHTFTVTGKVALVPTGTTVGVLASILRPADVNDPDATNPDNAAPTDPQAECDAAPSGKGCNNIKTDTLTFQSVPDAGDDQSVYQNEVATLTAKGPGNWLQVGSIPVPAVIAAPNAPVTTISGLTDIGIYKFVRYNTLGCTDTVNVTVLPKAINIPSIITPNGDGKNDTFTVPGIELFQGSLLIIFNRWGNEVYRSENYKNNWTGEGLSDGTYYYVLNKKEISGSVTTYKGWIFLKRTDR